MAKKYCPAATLASGKYRGQSGESHRRELRHALLDLVSDKHCDYLVVLTDADSGSWLEIYNREWMRIPDECKHVTVFGVADRNIECWLSLDRRALAEKLGCSENDIPSDNPSGFVKRRFGVSSRGQLRLQGVECIEQFVSHAPRDVIQNWIHNGRSFAHFWDQIFQLGKREHCHVPNERERQ